jgi:hypothetical protein
MSGSTRAAAASNSRRIKQRLVNILFREQHSKQGRDSHQKLDFASYSYAELRKAYLEKVQILHPDKIEFKKKDVTKFNFPPAMKWGEIEESPTWRDVEAAIKKESSRDLHEKFVDLKEAWDDYEKVGKLTKSRSDRDIQNNFTMFGVGCSFSDNPDEQRRRAEIMDQASRGWFSAGQIPEITKDDSKANSDFQLGKWSIRIKKSVKENVAAPLSTNIPKRRTLIEHMTKKKK